jgi:aromatic-L-amino-acid decarboxylase
LGTGSTGEVVDYRDWGIPLGRRFRSLKLWFVLRTYGIRGLQSHIRHHVKLAEEFEQWVRSDDRFEVIFPRSLSLVCFRLKGDDTLSKSLLDKLNSDGKFFLTHTVVNGKFCIRLAVGSPHTERTHLEECWNRIVSLAEHILQTERNHAQK